MKKSKNGRNLITLNYIGYLCKIIKKFKKIKHEILKNIRSGKNGEYNKAILKIGTHKIRIAKKSKKRCLKFLKLKHPDNGFFKVTRRQIDIKK